MKIRLLKAGQIACAVKPEQVQGLLDSELADSIHADDIRLYERSQALHMVPAWRFHAAIDARDLRARIGSAIDELSPAQRATARARLEYSLTYDRFDPLIDALGAALGLSEDDIDDLWLEASSL